MTLFQDSPQATDFATKLHQVVTRATPFFLSSGERTFFVEMKPSGIYTARDGGQAFRAAVEERLTTSLNSLIADDKGFPLLISIKNRFPDAWVRLDQADLSVAQTLEFSIESRELPYFPRNRVQRAKSLKLLVIPGSDAELDFTGEPVVLNDKTASDVDMPPRDCRQSGATERSPDLTRSL